MSKERLGFDPVSLQKKEMVRNFLKEEVKVGAVAAAFGMGSAFLAIKGETGYALLIGAFVGLPAVVVLQLVFLSKSTKRLTESINKLHRKDSGHDDEPPSLNPSVLPPSSSGPTLEGAGVPVPKPQKPPELEAKAEERAPVSVRRQ